MQSYHLIMEGIMLRLYGVDTFYLVVYNHTHKGAS